MKIYVALMALVALMAVVKPFHDAIPRQFRTIQPARAFIRPNQNGVLVSNRRTLKGSLGEYELRRPIELSVDGTVYKASEKQSGNNVAVKLFVDQKAVEREAAIIQSVGRYVDQGEQFLAMDLVQGESLTKILAQEAIEDVYSWFPQLSRPIYLLSVKKLLKKCSQALLSISSQNVEYEYYLLDYFTVLKDGQCILTDFSMAQVNERCNDCVADGEVEKFAAQFYQQERDIWNSIKQNKDQGLSKARTQKLAFGFGKPTNLGKWQ